MYRPLIAVFMLLGAEGAALGQAGAQEMQDKQAGIGRDTFVHQFLLAMQKCRSADYSAEQCGGVEGANEVRAIVGHLTNISGNEAYMRFDADNFSATDVATVHHLQLLVHKGSFSSDAIAEVIRSGCAKNGIILQVQIVDAINSSASQAPSWNLTLQAPDLTRESWIRFELGGQKWLHFSGQPFQLKITANCNSPASQILSIESRKEYEPYLVLYSKSPLSTQAARALQGVRQVARQRRTRRTSSACELRRYEVNANYCDGMCGDPENNTSLYYTSHARLQYYLSITQQPPPPVPRCVPGSYSTVAMLFSEDGNTILRIFQDLSASSCQCL
eukprot:Em0021g188a